MDKICLYLLNRFKFIGNYVFETRNGNLYINGYKLEKIVENRNTFHSIKLSMSLSEFGFLEIDELMDLTIDYNSLINLYKSFKKFFDSEYSSQFMNNDYESKDNLITKIRNLIKNDRLDIRTADSLISFIITQKKTYWYTRNLFMYDFSINLRKINHEWLIEISFKESFINPIYLDLISKIKGRKIYDIYLDIYPIEKRDNKLFINNQRFRRVVDLHSGDYTELYTYYKSKEFSSEDLFKYEDLLSDEDYCFDLLNLINKFIKSQLIEKINKLNWKYLISELLLKNDYEFENFENYIKILINYRCYKIKLIANSKFLNLLTIKFYRLNVKFLPKLIISIQFEKNNNENNITLDIGYDHIRKEWKNKFSRLKLPFPEITLVDHLKELKEKLPSDVPIRSTTLSTNIYRIVYSSENYKDLISQFDKLIDQKISYIFIDGVDKLFEIFINKFRIILDVDQMEEILSNSCNSNNKRFKMISEYLSKINFDHKLIKEYNYNEIKIPLEPDNDLDIITLKQEDSDDHIKLSFELEIYINLFNFKIELKYFKDKYKINCIFHGRFYKK